MKRTKAAVEEALAELKRVECEVRSVSAATSLNKMFRLVQAIGDAAQQDHRAALMACEAVQAWYKQAEMPRAQMLKFVGEALDDAK